MSFRAAIALVLWCSSLACTGGGGTGQHASTSSAGTGGAHATSTGNGGAGTGGAGAGTGGAGAGGPPYTIEVITDRHRAIPGKMFGGWGPHLGHLVRAPGPGGGSALYWADDVCTPGTCDVLHDAAVGVLRRDADGWKDLGDTPLPGAVQQNTGTLADGGVLHTYGVDVAGHAIIACTFDTKSLGRSCGALSFSLSASANYIGAAISPGGSKLVWWTDVVDGGGGSFEYIVDYGGGWNGPRVGPAGGYNDASYIHIGFRTDTTAFTMHAELVSGLAPSWTFLGAVGEGDLATTNAVTWQNALAAPAGDTIQTTDDILIDPVTNDTHLFARTASGASAYYFRPKGGAWSGPLTVLANAARVRFSPAPAGLAITYGGSGTGLLWRLAPAPTAGQPVDFGAAIEQKAPLPTGYETIYAIYPEARVYQSSKVGGINVAVVGSAKENEALFVGITP